MKRTCIIGLLAGVLAIGITGAAPAKTPFETARGQAIALHRSLINDAKPQVRVKISASARAAKSYLVRSRQDCDLYQFCANDLRTRFPRITEQELQVLMVLVSAEIFSDSQMANIDLQNVLQKQQQLIQLISNVAKSQEDTALSVIRKIG
jgi:hypothetical protein